MECNWSNLPTDLLRLILNSITLTLTDVICFSSVCTSWRFAVSTFIHRRHLPHQSPWLMFVGAEDPNSAQSYCFSNNKVYTIPNQPYRPIANRVFIGSGHGWLITADEKLELSLLNPITRQQIELPPVTTLNPMICCFHRGYGLRTRSFGIRRCTAEGLRHWLKATISSSPASGDYIVALLPRHSDLFACARTGDKKWTVIDNVDCTKDIAFHEDGKIYTFNQRGCVVALDFNQTDLSFINPRLVFERQAHSSLYLVGAPWGEIFLVYWDKFGHYDQDSPDYLRQRVDIWRIGSGMKLTKLESLGDYAFFLGDKNSICVSSKDNPDLQANCFYLVDECIGCKPECLLFSLEDGSFERIIICGRMGHLRYGLCQVFNEPIKVLATVN